VLPPGPREYWQTLAEEHKNAPEHQKWMYEADPFAAKKALEERQAKAAKARGEQEALQGSGERRPKKVFNEYDKAPEVRMAGSLRELVEDAIKKVLRFISLDDRTY
jgi:ATP-dependent RNA helicase DHX57